MDVLEYCAVGGGDASGLPVDTEESVTLDYRREVEMVAVPGDERRACNTCAHGSNQPGHGCQLMYNGANEATYRWAHANRDLATLFPLPTARNCPGFAPKS